LLGGTAIGAFAGPIGALAGLTLGLIFGGGGKAKQHDTAIENAGFAQIKQLVEEYERHRLDYAQTYEGIQSVYQQMVGQFQRSASRQNASYWYQQYLAHIQRIEDERNRRRGLSLPVPEFASGGLVGGAAGGGVLAMLHPGEFVMSSEAVQRFGADLLERMNSGAAGGDGYVMQVWTPSKEFAAQVVEMGTPVVIGRGGAAKRLLRG
ncbi:MAG TPA: hypothetical protein VNN17_04945, partial [Terriglobia bacterium]|nr:hypothetical protein [Terriglobia bacterium]